MNETPASPGPDNVPGVFSDARAIDQWVAAGRENTLSVVIPAHNEAGNLDATVRALVGALKAAGVEHEILIANDGSTDATSDEVAGLENEFPAVRHVDNIPPHGFGRAVRCGLVNATGDAMVIVMADGSDAPEDVVAFHAKLREGYDCVFGTRFSAGGSVVDYPVHKLILNRLANTFVRVLFGLRYNDTTNAFKCYRRSVIAGLQPLLSNHFNLTVEMPLKAIIRGYSYAVLPNTWRNRKVGMSKLRIREMGSRYLFIVLYCFLEKLLSRGDYIRPPDSPHFPKPPMPERPKPDVRLGLIGGGRWGRAFIRTIGEVGGARLASLATRNPENRNLVGSGCRIESDWHDLVQSPDIDGIIIATPPHLHAEMARAAISAQMPVLIEKPLTTDVNEARQLLALADEHDALAMVDHTHVHSDAFSALLEKLPELGPVTGLRSAAGNRGPFRPDVSVLWDWGAHDVAMCLAVTGASPVGVRARSIEVQETEAGDGECLNLELDFEGGLRAVIELSNLRPGKVRTFTVEFADARLVYDDLAPHKLTLIEVTGATGEPVPVEAGLPLNRVVECFVRAIRSGGGERSSLRLGVDVTDVLARCEAVLAA